MRRHDEQVERLQQSVDVIAVAEEEDFPLDAEGDGFRLQLRQIRTIADEHEPRFLFALMQVAEGIQQERLVFLVLQAPNMTNYEAIFQPILLANLAPNLLREAEHLRVNGVRNDLAGQIHGGARPLRALHRARPKDVGVVAERMVIDPMEEALHMSDD